MKEIGVPVLNLEVDCIDERNFVLGQLKTRVEAFAETILGRKAAPVSGDREATARA